jgi:hypothetical protein
MVALLIRLNINGVKSVTGVIMQIKGREKGT